MAFGFKGGIGTASRKTGAYTVGVLVQSNFGGTLVMNGAPVGRELAAGGPIGQWVDYDDRGHRRSRGCAQLAPYGGADYVRIGAHGLVGGAAAEISQSHLLRCGRRRSC